MSSSAWLFPAILGSASSLTGCTWISVIYMERLPVRPPLPSYWEILVVRLPLTKIHGWQPEEQLNVLSEPRNMYRVNLIWSNRSVAEGGSEAAGGARIATAPRANCFHAHVSLYLFPYSMHLYIAVFFRLQLLTFMVLSLFHSSLSPCAVHFYGATFLFSFLLHLTFMATKAISFFSCFNRL